MRCRVAELAEADRRTDGFPAPIQPATQGVRPRGSDPREGARGRTMIEGWARHRARRVDVARIVRGQIPPRTGPADPAGAAARDLAETRPRIRARRLDLDVILPDRPNWLEADPTRLEQVLVNFLTHAAASTDLGGPTRLPAAREGDRADLLTRNDDLVLAQEMLPKAFERPAPADHLLNRPRGGLGLGQTRGPRLARMDGGAARAEVSGPGREFLAHRSAPLKEGLGAAPAEAMTVAASAGPGGLRVLIVDDNVFSAESLVMLVRIWGHEARAAHDGPSTLAQVTSFRPQVVILDIGLPGMDGYEVARRLRTEVAPAPALLIAMTGYGRDEDRQRSREAGFDHHLVKPVNLDHLQELLRSPPEA